ncbi:MAG TPA: hypothetical protein VNT99_07410, partial [Methylomirabilota bacterium]|nr:hypothetical protein [Methylomirabilota bacterium]
MALPLFPVLTNMPLAVTTNREVARGIAFDGTNFLAVFQGDNLYASAGTTNQLAGQFISSDGALLGGRIDLELNGSIPLVAFDGTNHLVVWMDPANSIPGVYGQFLNRDGTKIGGEFLIHSNAAIGEVGALVFAFGQHFVIWSATNAASNVALIAAQRVSPSGTLMGSVLALGAAQSDAQQFPTLAVGHTNLLVTWTARRSDTNLWNVMGRFVDASGSTSTEFVISQESAWAAYPSAAAFGGSNYLVAWSREAEPWSSFFIGYQNQQEVFTNRLFPTLFGRLVNSGGAMAQNEFQIVRARWGQFSPALAFDGTNFVLVWNDRRFSTDQQYYGTYLNRLRFRDDIVPAYTPFARFIGRDGTLVETEFIVHNTDSSFPAFASGSSVGPKCLVVGDSGFLLRNTIGLSGGVNDDVSFITLKRGLYLPPQFSVVGVTNNSLRLKMDSPNAYCVHAANDLKNWPTSTNLFPWWDPQQNSFAEGASV